MFRTATKGNQPRTARTNAEAHINPANMVDPMVMPPNATQVLELPNIPTFPRLATKQAFRAAKKVGSW